jgi:hypothetical protein
VRICLHPATRQNCLQSERRCLHRRIPALQQIKAADSKQKKAKYRATKTDNSLIAFLATLELSAPRSRPPKPLDSVVSPLPLATNKPNRCHVIVLYCLFIIEPCSFFGGRKLHGHGGEACRPCITGEYRTVLCYSLIGAKYGLMRKHRLFLLDEKKMCEKNQ